MCNKNCSQCPHCKNREPVKPPKSEDLPKPAANCPKTDNHCSLST
jgi:hypothetical protein